MSRVPVAIDASRHGSLFYMADSGAVRQTHRHEALEYNLVVRGTAAYVMQDRRYQLPTHALVWLFPGQEHVLTDLSDDFAMWVIVVRPSVVRALVRQGAAAMLQARNPPAQTCYALLSPQARQLAQLLVQLSQQIDDAALFNAGFDYVTMLAWRMSSTSPVVSSIAVHPAIERTLTCVGDDPSIPIHVLAQRVGLSAGRLGRLFVRQMGMTLTEYRNQLRLDLVVRAVEAHGSGQLLVHALAAGFGSYAQFHRVFRQRFRVSPGSWQRQFSTD